MLVSSETRPFATLCFYVVLYVVFMFIHYSPVPGHGYAYPRTPPFLCACCSFIIASLHPTSDSHSLLLLFFFLFLNDIKIIAYIIRYITLIIISTSESCRHIFYHTYRNKVQFKMFIFIYMSLSCSHPISHSYSNFVAQLKVVSSAVIVLDFFGIEIFIHFTDICESTIWLWSIGRWIDSVRSSWDCIQHRRHTSGKLYRAIWEPTLPLPTYVLVNVEINQYVLTKHYLENCCISR